MQQRQITAAAMNDVLNMSNWQVVGLNMVGVVNNLGGGDYSETDEHFCPAAVNLN